MILRPPTNGRRTSASQRSGDGGCAVPMKSSKINLDRARRPFSWIERMGIRVSSFEAGTGELFQKVVPISTKSKGHGGSISALSLLLLRSEPRHNLAARAGATLYGTGSAGGNWDAGTAFSVNTNGTGFANFYVFDSADGLDPLGGLVLSGNTMFGINLCRRQLQQRHGFHGEHRRLGVHSAEKFSSHGPVHRANVGGAIPQGEHGVGRRHSVRDGHIGRHCGRWNGILYQH